ncbi:MAG: WYL domain-containing protein [Gemmatimonadota bacterium]
MTDAGSQQLRRVLAMIPECADDKAHPIAEFAGRAGVSPAVLIKDIRALADRFDDPGGFVEGVALYLESDRFQVRSEHFLRPMRLTVAELGALELGLSLLGHERPPEELPVLSRARDRLHAALAKLPNDDLSDGIRHAGAAATANPEALAALRRAYRESRKIRIGYLKADAEEPSNRIISPFGIVFASGNWYLVGRSDGADGIKVYRVDRIVSHEMLDERYEMPESFEPADLFQNGRAFAATVAERVRIRFAPKAARWVAEREGKPLEADGTFVQELPLADLDWLVRYVMQYGAEAQVLEPEAARSAVRERLLGLLDSMPSGTP